jgi:hypothetical protein
VNHVGLHRLELGQPRIEQHVRLDFMGLPIDSLELIRYDPETKTFPSTVYSNLSPAVRWMRPLPAPGARTGPSRAAGARTPVRTRPSTTPTTSAAIASGDRPDPVN